MDEKEKVAIGDTTNTADNREAALREADRREAHLRWELANRRAELGKRVNLLTEECYRLASPRMRWLTIWVELVSGVVVATAALKYLLS